MKKYVSKLEDLNEYERKYNKISYERLIKRIGNVWLFNKAYELSDYEFELVLGDIYDEENDEYKDIYQYYLIDIDEYTLELLQKANCEDLIIAWSEKLEEYILCVDHFGTSWDYVLTSIEPTTNLNEADI